MPDLRILFWVALAILAVFVLRSIVRIVPQGYNWTVENFGKYSRTLTPGLNFLTPFVEAIGHRVNMMEQVIDIPRQEVITKDNAAVGADAVAFFQVLEASQAVYRVSGLANAVLQLVTTNIRTVLGSMDLDEILSKREEISTKVLQSVDHATNSWGVKITRIEIKDISPPARIAESMSRQMMAERARRAEVTVAEGNKAAAVLQAEGRKAAVILDAEGKLEAARLEAEARKALAEAEAEAIERVSKAAADGEALALNYFIAQGYTKAFEKLAGADNQKVVLVPYDTSSLIGTIAGIAEIAKTAEPGARAARPSRSDAGLRPTQPARTAVPRVAARGDGSDAS